MPHARRLRVGAIDMEYEEQGRGTRPFVLVHGFTGGRDDWADVKGELAALGHTVMPDQRGHGGSTNTGEAEGYHLDQLAEDLAGFLDALGHERVDLLGHSMGGMVVLRTALARPERIASLVLMNTSAHPIDALSPEALALAREVAFSEGMGRLHEIGRSLAEGDPDLAPSRVATARRMGERYWERIRAKLESMDPHAFVELGARLGDHEPVTERLGEIDCPTTVMVGEEDVRFLAATDVLERGVPGARRVTIPDAAHSPQLENTEAWLRVIREHLAWARGS